LTRHNASGKMSPSLTCASPKKLDPIPSSSSSMFTPVVPVSFSC
jgi:hypothetical protein